MDEYGSPPNPPNSHLSQGHLTTVTDKSQLLEKIVVKRWQFGALITWAVLALIGGGFTLFLALVRHRASIYWPIGIVAFCFAGAILSYVVAKWQYENWSFEVHDESLVLRHGVFWKTERYVARGRIQHLDINSGPIDRRFNVVEVGIFVAGSAGSVGSIPGLSNERAEQLRDFLLQKREAHG